MNQSLVKERAALGGKVEEVMLQISNSEMGQSESASVLQSEVDRLCLNQREARMNCLLSRMKERDNDEKSSAELGEMTAANEENLKLVGPNSELKTLRQQRAVKIESLEDKLKSEEDDSDGDDEARDKCVRCLDKDGGGKRQNEQG